MAAVINRSLRLPDNQYFPSFGTKTGIAVHHTVGGTGRSTFEYWKNSPDMVGTAYIIERDGTIFEVFDPKAWAWQFGLTWPQEEKILFEKRFIGIEIASEGALIESNGKLYCFGVVSAKTLKDPAEAFDYGQQYRGYRYFDKYEKKQIDSLITLINELTLKFNIPKQTPADQLEYHGDKLKDFTGIIGHTMVRKDKTDPAPDVDFWKQIVNACGLKTKDMKSPTMNPERNLTEQELEQLFSENILQINEMNIAAGSMVKGLIMELQRGDRNTYIRLHDAVKQGHQVSYAFLQGDKGLVFRIARALGFKDVTESRLEVAHD